MRVVAIDTGEDKRKLVLDLGAEKWIDYRESKDVVADVVAATDGGAHAAVVIAGSRSAFDQAAGYLRNTGTLVVVGLPKDGMLSVPTVLLAGKVSSVANVSLGFGRCNLVVLRVSRSVGF